MSSQTPSRRPGFGVSKIPSLYEHEGQEFEKRHPPPLSVLLFVILVHLAISLGRGRGRRLQLGHLAARGAPVGQHLHVELAQAHAKRLEEPGLPRVEHISFFAHLVPLTLAFFVAQHHLALHHPGRHPQPPQFRLQRVRHGHVVLGRHLAAGRVENARGDCEGPRGDSAGTGEVDGREVLKVLEDRLRRPVREEKPHRAVHVLGEAVDAVGLGLLGVATESPRGEFGLAEEETANGGGVPKRKSLCAFSPGEKEREKDGCEHGWQDLPTVVELMPDILQVVVPHVVDAEDEAVLVLRDSGADVLEKLVLLLAALLAHLREVEDLRSF